MELQEIKQFFIENAEKDEVKSYLSELSKVNESAIIEDFKKSKDYIAEIDRSVSKAVESHDTKIKPKLEKELRDKIQLELNPPKDPNMVALQNQIEELKKAQNEKDALIAQKERVNFWHQSLQPEYKDFVKLFDGTIEDDAEKAKFINTALFNLQAAGTSKPAQSKQSSVDVIKSKEDLKDLPSSKIVELYDAGKLDGILNRQ